MKNIFLILATLIALASCKPSDSTPAPFSFNKPGGTPVVPTTPSSMVLVSPATSPAFIANPNIALYGVVAGETIKVYRNSTCTTLIGTVTASSTSASLTVSALPVGTYSFYTKVNTAYSTGPCSAALLSYTYLGIAPKTATSITLQTPASSPSAVATPTVLLGGVVSGETSYLYINNLCTDLYGQAVAAGTTVAITTLALSPGTHQFYTNSSNAAGTGTCSSALLSYTYTGVAPVTATSLALKFPLTSPNYDSTPEVTLSGVANGDHVYLYRDSLCATPIGDAIATKTSTVDITSSALAVAAHTFYSQSTNTAGTSACSLALGSYTYNGPPPTVAVSWTANRESAVNKAGGGYKVYYSSTSGFDVTTASFVNVPWVSGPTAPTTVNFTTLMAGVTYFKVEAYSILNAPGTTTGSKSSPSTQFSVTIP